MLIFIGISNAWSVLKCKQTAMKDESSGHYSTENWNSMLHLRKARKCILEIANHIKYNITKFQTSSFLFAKNPQFSNIPGRKIHKVYIAYKPISKANQDLSCGEKSQNKQLPYPKVDFSLVLRITLVLDTAPFLSQKGKKYSNK